MKKQNKKNLGKNLILIFLTILFTSVFIYASKPNPGHNYSELNLGPINIQQNEININGKFIMKDSLCIGSDQEENCKSSWSFTDPSKWVKSGSNIYYGSGGLVGIGTSSPSQILQVVGNVNIDDGYAYYFYEQELLRIFKGSVDLPPGHWDGSPGSTFIGINSEGWENVGGQTIAGYSAGSESSFGQTAIGAYAGYQNTGFSQTAIGYEAGRENKGNNVVSIGYQANKKNKGNDVLAIGNKAGFENEGNITIAIGYEAGYQNKKNWQTVIGYQAGHQNHGHHQIALGYKAGAGRNWEPYTIAIGYEAGYGNMGARTIGIGYRSTSYAGWDTIALGANSNNFLGNRFVVQNYHSGDPTHLQWPLISGDLTSGFLGIKNSSLDYRLNLPNLIISGQGRANQWISASSIRWKENINNLDGTDSVDKIMNLNPVSYDWKQEYGGSKSIGFIAEEVGKVIPEAVDFDDEGIFADGLSINPIVAYLVKVSQEQEKTLNKIKEKSCFQDSSYSWC